MPVKPLAIGIVNLAGGHAARAGHNRHRRARVDLAASAQAEGYAVLEIFEVGTNTVRDEIAVAAAMDLVRRYKISTVLALGPVPELMLRQVRDAAVKIHQVATRAASS